MLWLIDYRGGNTYYTLNLAATIFSFVSVSDRQTKEYIISAPEPPRPNLLLKSIYLLEFFWKFFNWHLVFVGKDGNGNGIRNENVRRNFWRRQSYWIIIRKKIVVWILAERYICIIARLKTCHRYNKPKTIAKMEAPCIYITRTGINLIFINSMWALLQTGQPNKQANEKEECETKKKINKKLPVKAAPTTFKAILTMRMYNKTGSLLFECLWLLIY